MFKSKISTPLLFILFLFFAVNFFLIRETALSFDRIASQKESLALLTHRRLTHLRKKNPQIGYNKLISSPTSFINNNKSYCAYRDGLAFQFHFKRNQVETVVWMLGNKDYFEEEELHPIQTSLLQEKGAYFWNISLLGNQHHFKIIPAYDSSFLISTAKGRREIIFLGKCAT